MRPEKEITPKVTKKGQKEPGSLVWANLWHSCSVTWLSLSGVHQPLKIGFISLPAVLVIHCYWTNCPSIQKLKAMTFLPSLLCSRPGNQAHVVGWLWCKISHKIYIMRLGTHMQALPARYLPPHWLSGAAGRIYSCVQRTQGFNTLSKGLTKVACLWQPGLSRRMEEGMSKIKATAIL